VERLHGGVARRTDGWARLTRVELRAQLFEPVSTMDTFTMPLSALTGDTARVRTNRPSSGEMSAGMHAATLLGPNSDFNRRAACQRDPSGAGIETMTIDRAATVRDARRTSR